MLSNRFLRTAVVFLAYGTLSDTFAFVPVMFGSSMVTAGVAVLATNVIERIGRLPLCVAR